MNLAVKIMGMFEYPMRYVTSERFCSQGRILVRINCTERLHMSSVVTSNTLHVYWPHKLAFCLTSVSLADNETYGEES
jgi:hypothetical protein